MMDLHTAAAHQARLYSCRNEMHHTPGKREGALCACPLRHHTLHQNSCSHLTVSHLGAGEGGRCTVGTTPPLQTK